MGGELEELFDDEFGDTAEDPSADLPRLYERIDLSILRHPTVVPSIAVFALSMTALVWPGRTDLIFARLVALALFAVGVAALRRGAGSRRGADAAVGVGFIALAAWIVLGRRESSEILAQTLGGAAIAFAVVEIVRLARERQSHGIDRWRAVRAAAILAFGLAFIVAGPALIELAIALTAAAAAVVAVIAIAISLDPDHEGVASLTESEQLVRYWLAERPKSADDRRELYNKLLFEGPTASRRIARFAILMSFASVIASMGVVTDSTAVVIGAMLIAPLMTPLMASSMSLIMGWPTRLRTSLSITLFGILLAIGIGMLVGLIVPATIDTATNSQILGRVSPTTLDLITALAAGAAGAYGLSRPDVSDSLPGVAIAISLVPPLAVVGIAYSQGDVGAGNGALLLFTTNALAIIAMGGVTFVLTGVTPIERVADNQRRMRTWFATLLGLGALVFGALFLNGATVARNSVEQTNAEKIAERWAEGFPDSAIVEVVLNDETIRVVVIGPSDAGYDAPELADELAERLDRSVTVDIRHVIQDRLWASSG